MGQWEVTTSKELERAGWSGGERWEKCTDQVRRAVSRREAESSSGLQDPSSRRVYLVPWHSPAQARLDSWRHATLARSALGRPTACCPSSTGSGRLPPVHCYRAPNSEQISSRPLSTRTTVRVPGRRSGVCDVVIVAP